MGTREDLDALLCDTIKSENVYFQPPESIRIQYPCLVYVLSGFTDTKADDETYNRKKQYSLTYITLDPDDEAIEKIADLKFCSMGTPYTSDNLHHYPYTIYY